MAKEIWKDIPGHERFYQASTFGRIKSLTWPVRRNLGFYNKPETILKPQKTIHGYLVVNLKTFDYKNIHIHKLIAITFIDKDYRKKRLQVNHKNGIKTDNRLYNLEIVSRSENIIHAIKTGLIKPLKGENAPSAKITEKDVSFIRELHSSGCLSQREIGLIFNLKRGSIAGITQKRNWRHVK